MDQPYQSHTRRLFLGQLAAAGALAVGPSLGAAPAPSPMRVQVFTKHLDGFSYADMAGMAAEAGFSGLDLTVRPGGHVLPERVADDLPQAVEAARKAGIAIPTIVTALTGADSPQAEAIIQTAAGQGVQAYRTGWINYGPNEAIERGLERFRKALGSLAALNKTHQIHGAYQNHHGLSLGAPVWDLAEVLQGQDARYMGCQYDLYHATIEGADSWPLGFRRIHPYVRTLDVKDFRWAGAGKKMHPETVPLGEGMVDFPRLFQMVKQLPTQPLLSMHFEYPMPTAAGGADARRQLVALMKKDLTVLQGLASDCRFVIVRKSWF